MVPVAVGGGNGGGQGNGYSETVRLADTGVAGVGHGFPQLSRVGQAMNRVTGALNVTGVAGGTTTTSGVALANTIVLRQAVCDTTQTEVELPEQAEDGG